MASGEMSDQQFVAFNSGWIDAVLPHLIDGGVFGTFIDWRGYPTVHAAATQLGLTPLNLIVWAKTNAGMGSLYRSQHELLPLFKKGERRTSTTSHLASAAAGARIFGPIRRILARLRCPPRAGGSSDRQADAMFEDALLDLTHRGDIVLDPFLGSGSTLMACEEDGPDLPRHRTRSALCRRHHSPVSKRDRTACNFGEDWRNVRRTC